jgi:DNA-directed RNA polymerase specialized sigma24 family protein
MEEVRDLAVQVASEDPEQGLRAVSALRRLLERLERIHVENARRGGYSWQEIADELGVSKQAVHQKHAAGIGSRRSKRR